jgi:hypothetical protein
MPPMGHAGYTSIRPLAFSRNDDDCFRSELAAPLIAVVPRTRVGLNIPGMYRVTHGGHVNLYPNVIVCIFNLFLIYVEFICNARKNQMF